MVTVRELGIIIFTVTLDVIAQNRNNERCGIHTTGPYPWVVGIESRLPNRLNIMCSGILIDKQYVITNKLNLGFLGGPKSVRLGVGGNCTRNQCTDVGISVPIEEIIPHPNHTDSIQSPHNLALIKLSSAVPYSDAVRPICLPSADVTRIASTDRHLYFTGISFGLSEQMFDLPMTYVDNDHCTSSLKAQFAFCANTVDAKECPISGAGLMNKRGETYELVGLIDEKHCNMEKVFIDLFLYVDWIRSRIPSAEQTFVYRNGDDAVTTSTPTTKITTTKTITIEKGCGRRKVDHIELIVNGESTKAGDWPWHVAIYRIDKSNFKYICGGTLISRTTVLTAAHCATIDGAPVNPAILSVVLGKHNLWGGDLNSQERQVHTVIVHEDFAPMNHLENDIALLKLRSQAVYNDYVQPACIWTDEAYDRLRSNKDYGTVVGWGIDQSDVLSSQLKQAYMPKVSDTKCIRRNPIFYANVLNNEKKFCAGWANGTSACNGDSGGGFLVFVPDTAEDSVDAVGAWYIRGIVSLSAALRAKARCDPTQYVVFTDVDKYYDWITAQLDN